MLKRFLTAVCATIAISTVSAFAQAQPTRVGGLTCDAAPRVGMVVGSRTNLRCMFRANDTGRQYGYKGTMTRIGLDIGATGGGRLFWAVFAPTHHVGYGALKGTYVGASGGAAFGPGLGANVLVGGSRNTISLQPLSLEGQFGLSVAAGVARLTLR